MKNVTSIGLSEMNGVKVLAYQYDEINDLGRMVRDNMRDSLVILKTPENTEILNAIKVLEDFAQKQAELI